MNYVNPILAKLEPKLHNTAEIRSALDEHYEMLGDLVEGVAKNHFHLVVNGPTGSGKTEFVKSVLKAHAKRTPHFNSGSLSAVMLFKLLFENRRSGSVLVIDDTDSIFSCVEAIEILKAALDTQQGKTIEWNKYSTVLQKEGVPTSFKFEGRVIIITNTAVNRTQDTAKNKRDKLLLPLWSRVTYFAAGLPNRAWEVEAIRMFADAGQIRCFGEHKIPKAVREEIIDFVSDNADSWLDLNFRMVSQLCALFKSNKAKWQRQALVSLTQ